MLCMEATDWTGLAADFLLFAGGIILALDAVMAVRHFEEESRRLKTFKSSVDKLRLETEDRQPIKNEDDVRLISIRRVAFWAKIGAGALVLGYLLQLVTKLIEISQK